jgi:hypothetical protein
MIADSATRRDSLLIATAGAVAGVLGQVQGTHAQQAHTTSQPSDATRFDGLANLPFENNRPTAATARTLKDELLFQRATQTYLWALLPRSNAIAFDELKWLVDSEGTNLAGPDWLGMLQGIGIVAGQPFKPEHATRAILDAAAMTGYKTSRVIGFEQGLNGVDFRVYKDRKWLNPINNLTARWPTSPLDLEFRSRSKTGFRELDASAWFFTDYYSISPGMVSMTPGKGAFYMIAFEDADGHPLVGDNAYTVRLPRDIPAGLFWSATLYEAENASGLDNGQPFPSLGKLDNPTQAGDGSTTLTLSPKPPADGKRNWLATVPGRGFFAILRLYLPEKAAIDGSWKPGDIEKTS